MLEKKSVKSSKKLTDKKQKTRNSEFKKRGWFCQQPAQTESTNGGNAEAAALQIDCMVDTIRQNQLPVISPVCQKFL